MTIYQIPAGESEMTEFNILDNFKDYNEFRAFIMRKFRSPRHPVRNAWRNLTRSINNQKEDMEIKLANEDFKRCVNKHISLEMIEEGGE